MTAFFEDRDPSVRPADDLFRHVNGSWLSATTIPDDQASTGSFRVLRDNSEAAVRDILAELSSGNAHELRQAASESTDHEVELLAELYRRFMDADAVEDAGTGPLAPILARIDRVTTTSEFMTLLGQHYRESLGALFYLADESDPADPTRYVPWMGQAGPGLPDEAYTVTTTRLKFARPIRATLPVCSPWPGWMTPTIRHGSSWISRPRSRLTTGIRSAAEI